MLFHCLPLYTSKNKKQKKINKNTFLLWLYITFIISNRYFKIQWRHHILLNILFSTDFLNKVYNIIIPCAVRNMNHYYCCCYILDSYFCRGKINILINWIVLRQSVLHVFSIVAQPCSYHIQLGIENFYHAPKLLFCLPYPTPSHLPPCRYSSYSYYQRLSVTWVP